MIIVYGEMYAFVYRITCKIFQSLLEVDVMPGLGDPSTYLMPQQPIHRAVFEKSSKHGKMLNLVTNPYHFSLEGIHILGTSGELNQNWCIMNDFTVILVGRFIVRIPSFISGNAYKNYISLIKHCFN